MVQIRSRMTTLGHKTTTHSGWVRDHLTRTKVRRPMQTLQATSPYFLRGWWLHPLLMATLEEQESGLETRTAMQAAVPAPPVAVEAAPVVGNEADHATVDGLAARRCLPIGSLPGASWGRELRALER